MARGAVGQNERGVTPAHIVVCGGTLEEWEATSPGEWVELIGVLARALETAGARWVTVVPYAGAIDDVRSRQLRERIAGAVHGSTSAERVTFIAPGGVVFTIDTCGDGRRRLVSAIDALPAGARLDEEMVGAAIHAPAASDPDLIVVFGPPTRLPPSLVWELAYGEIVFFDTSWRECNVEHLHMAVDDFQRRDRRFGGVDS